MARVSFSQDMDYRPTGARRVVIAYKGGRVYGNVKEEAAVQAEQEGKGVRLPTLPRPAREEAFNGADPARFDHDGDGRPGGSRRGRRRKAST